MKRLFYLIAVIILFFTFAFPVFAENNNFIRGNDCVYSGGAGIGEIATIECIPVIFSNAIYWLLILSGTVAIFLIIFGGIKFLTSGGDQKSVDTAKKIITWAVIGLVVILLSFGIVAFVAQTTGVACIRKFGFDQCGLRSENTGIEDPYPGRNCTSPSQCHGGTDCYNNKCLFQCSNSHHNPNEVWCPTGQTCKRFRVNEIDPESPKYYKCAP